MGMLKGKGKGSNRKVGMGRFLWKERAVPRWGGCRIGGGGERINKSEHIFKKKMMKYFISILISLKLL